MPLIANVANTAIIAAAVAVSTRPVRERPGRYRQPQRRRTVLPMRTVLIVDRNPVLQFVDIHPDYTGRTEVNDILAALQKLPS